ncbi:MAG: chemotaxis response regulator protein-glutamate methylesterase [Gammaproteobacteria bacterium]|nr:chemotaxis response regulator protein-glutamate methylesterase [Gammaproteobacteria bacterium]
MAIINVLVVDDSAVVRQVISNELSKDKSINVIAAVADPIFAMKRMGMQWPDVIVLDVEMPRMDGITFLKKIMAERPTPVVICSTLTIKGAETTMQALDAGAVTIITKPKVGVKNFLEESSNELIHAVKTAACANTKNLIPRKTPTTPTLKPTAKLTADAVLTQATVAMTQTTDKVIAIGTSCGGTQALEFVLSALPKTCQGIVIVQHMPEKFTAAFAARVNSISEIDVREAQNGDRVIPGQALIAPGGKHLLLTRSGAQYRVEVRDGPLVNRHRPSVDVLFRSVAKCAGKNAVGIIMTGMGDDGAHGMAEMHDQGAYTIAQNQETCVVFGMPKEAIKLGGVDKIMSLQDIVREIINIH